MSGEKSRSSQIEDVEALMADMGAAFAARDAKFERDYIKPKRESDKAFSEAVAEQRQRIEKTLADPAEFQRGLEYRKRTSKLLPPEEN